MERYDFDKVIDRRGTDSVKADSMKDMFGREDLLAAWVADMDFPTPDFILDALKKRLEHPVLGYTREPADYRPAIIDWERHLHGWDIKPEWLSYIPGIVKGIGMVVNVFTRPGDDVIIMPPVYHPFRIITEANGRNVVNVPLIEDESNRYHIDYDALEQLPLKKGLMIFSNPHNPAGRVWEREELERLAEICHRKGILVVSDEIHADMTLWGGKHTPFATVSDEAAANSITFCAPSKTFNIPGIVSSFSVIPGKEVREKFYGWMMASEFEAAPMMSYIATIAAYRHGDSWRRQMLEYIEGNIKFVEEYCRENIPGVKATRPGASFLVWLDCRALGLSHDELISLFVDKAGVALNDGEMFGKEGAGMMRLNVAAPRSVIAEVMRRIADAVNGI